MSRPYFKISKDGEDYFSPMFHNKTSAKKMLRSAMPLPEGANFYIQGNILDKVNNLKPMGYDGSKIISGYTSGDHLKCTMKNNRIYLNTNYDGFAGMLRYNDISLNFSDMIIGLRIGGHNMNNTPLVGGHDYLLDIGHLFYILRIQGTTTYRIRTRPTWNGSYIDFDLGEFSSEVGIVCIFNGDNLTVYVNGEEVLRTSEGVYPKGITTQMVGLGCHYSTGETVKSEKNDNYISSAIFGNYLGTVWQGTTGINTEYVESTSENKGYFYTKKKSIENNVFQNSLITRDENGDVPYTGKWSISSD